MDFRQNLHHLQYHTARLTQRMRFRRAAPPGAGWPVLLGISFPKSGTNLLRQVLAAFARVAPYADRSFDVFAAFDAASGAARDAGDALAFLARLQPGDIAAAHLLAWPEVVAEVRPPRYSAYFIYRDPRDVVVSHVFYVTKRATEHVHHRYYNDVLTTFDERLTTSILGRPDAGVDFPDIRGRYEPYLGWLENPQVLPLRFEDFILDRRATLERVLDHYALAQALPAPRAEMLAILEGNIVPEKSPTFRSGKVGDWQRHFTDEHKTIFKKAAGDLLVRLGYENDDQW